MMDRHDKLRELNEANLPNPSYVEALERVIDFNENLEWEINEEYLRGQLELIADLWTGREGIDIEARMDEIRSDLIRVRGW